MVLLVNLKDVEAPLAAMLALRCVMRLEAVARDTDLVHGAVEATLVLRRFVSQVETPMDNSAGYLEGIALRIRNKATHGNLVWSTGETTNVLVARAVHDAIKAAALAISTGSERASKRFALSSINEALRSASNRPPAAWLEQAGRDAGFGHPIALALDFQEVTQSSAREIGALFSPASAWPEVPSSFPQIASVVVIDSTDADAVGAIDLYFSLDECGVDEIAEILAGLSDVYTEMTGDELIINASGVMDTSQLLSPVGDDGGGQ